MSERRLTITVTDDRGAVLGWVRTAVTFNAGRDERGWVAYCARCEDQGPLPGLDGELVFTQGGTGLPVEILMSHLAGTDWPLPPCPAAPARATT